MTKKSDYEFNIVFDNLTDSELASLKRNKDTIKEILELIKDLILDSDRKLNSSATSPCRK